MPAIPIDTSQIVITASRLPETHEQSPASVTVIDAARIERLGEPLLPALLRLAPTTSVSTSGPAGSLTEVRIRGAEANHTLLFIDGISANDPASGDTPRFELLNADIASRIEVIRGPQSALWGSAAIGGVIAVNGLDEPGNAGTLAVEGGAFGFRRAAGSASLGSDRASIAGAFGWQRATGIDSFGGAGGDKDGYRNLSGRLRSSFQVTPTIRVGAAFIGLTGRSEFDGYDPVTFEHRDTLDNSRNRLMAGRLWVEAGRADSPWSGRAGVALLGSSNRNFVADEPTNRTGGGRHVVDAQVERHFATGPLDHRIILAAEDEREIFLARGTISGLTTDQDRSRLHQSLTVEWRTSANHLSGDVAIRHDSFNRFKDATSLRASALVGLVKGFSLGVSYAEGIAQPTFFDLYGFFPGSFAGNPSLKPESSHGFEASLRYRRSHLQAALTAYRQKLRDEIVDVFDFTTFLSSTVNGHGSSRRSGVEAEISWQVRDSLRVTANYAYLKATQPVTSDKQVPELRRPKQSGSVAADGASGKWSYGASLAYVGSHLDVRDVAPFGVVRLKPYWLAGARIAYAISPRIELFVRGSNLLDAKYQEVSGYRTEGFGAYAGIRLAGLRSSR